MRNRKKRKFIYAWDGDDFGIIPEQPTVQELVNKVFDPLEGTSVDTIFLLLGIGHHAEYRSEFLPMIGESQDYHFNGNGTYRRYASVKHLLDQNHEPCEILINAARERNLDAFFAFRLNDIHDHWASYSDMLPSYKKDNPNWLNPSEWFPDFHGNNEITTSLNYSIKEVRDFRIRILREVMERYDFDGVELDFMRSPFYFHWDKGMSSAYIMTDFVREIREMLDGLAKLRGRSIELAVRVCTTVIGSMMAGFDVEDWAKRELVDIVIAGTGGMNIDTTGYKAILEGTGVSFFPCLYGDYERVASTDAVMRGVAEVLLSGEPDGIYAFNIYPDERKRRQLLSQIGNINSLKGINKTYIVDMDYDYILTKEEWRYRMHLPATLGETRLEGLVVPIQVGEQLAIYSSIKVLLKIWIKDWSQADVYVFRFNGHLLELPIVEQMRDEYGQCWLSWRLDPVKVTLKNEVFIQLQHRNPHLKQRAPAIVQRVNIDVEFDGE